MGTSKGAMGAVSSATTDLFDRPEALLIAAAAVLPLLLLANSLRPRKKIQSGAQSWQHARVVKSAVPLMGRSPSLPPSSAPPKPVDLSGCWLNTDIRGDFRAYMVAMGAPFLVRIQHHKHPSAAVPVPHRRDGTEIDECSWPASLSRT